MPARTHSTSRTLVAAAVALLLLVGAGCGDDDDSDSGDGGGSQAASSSSEIRTPAVIEEAGGLTACADMTYPPMTFVEANEPQGVDVDFGNRLAEMMGTEAEFSQTGFPGIIAALTAGKCDVILNGMNVSAERKQEIDFVIYAQATQTFMVPADKAQDYTSIEDFGGKTVGVQVGSTNLQFLKEENKTLPEPIDVKPFPKDPDAVSSLQTGKLDAYFADTAVVAYYVAQNPDAFAATDIALNPIPYGIGLRKDEPELRRALQQGVDAMYESGEAQEILDKWKLGEKAYREE
jgi:ABC-type amino acid transport substrate-binding protein